MSGGVDSSVAACLLREQGYDVVGLFMRTGTHTEALASTTCSLPVVTPGEQSPSHKRGCCSAVDAGDARRVADRLDIPFYAVDFEHEFGRIIDYFVDEYTHGRTPNPCVMCNNWLKFGRLWDYAQQIGADKIATGHYARIVHADAGAHQPDSAPPTDALSAAPAAHSLCRGVDPAKDQSYVLFGLDRRVLPHLIFPIGGHAKSQIRAIARTLGLNVADKPDSQEICFVPDDDYRNVIRKYRSDFDGSGELVDTSGNVIARHDGFERFTIGQRKGLGVALGERRYVVRIEPSTRRVVIGTRDDLMSRSLIVRRLNWLCDQPTRPFRCATKIRYLHDPAPSLVTPLDDDQVQVAFDMPQAAVTPGQAAVFYDGTRVLGGGFID
jgi:tRNA-specific 2-thiouridylase